MYVCVTYCATLHSEQKIWLKVKFQNYLVTLNKNTYPVPNCRAGGDSISWTSLTFQRSILQISLT